MEPTDFKNVIVENISLALFEAVWHDFWNVLKENYENSEWKFIKTRSFWNFDLGGLGCFWGHRDQNFKILLFLWSNFVIFVLDKIPKSMPGNLEKELGKYFQQFLKSVGSTDQNAL